MWPAQLQSEYQNCFSGLIFDRLPIAEVQLPFKHIWQWVNEELKMHSFTRWVKVCIFSLNQQKCVPAVYSFEFLSKSRHDDRIQRRLSEHTSSSNPIFPPKCASQLREECSLKWNVGTTITTGHWRSVKTPHQNQSQLQSTKGFITRGLFLTSAALSCPVTAQCSPHSKPLKLPASSGADQRTDNLIIRGPVFETVVRPK